MFGGWKSKDFSNDGLRYEERCTLRSIEYHNMVPSCVPLDPVFWADIMLAVTTVSRKDKKKQKKTTKT